MNQTAALFFQIGEPLAAGFFEEPDASTAKKFCRAYRRYFENCPVRVLSIRIEKKVNYFYEVTTSD